VCGTEGALTYDWRLRAGQRLQELRAQAAALHQADGELQAASSRAARLVTATPEALREAGDAGVSTVPALQAWQRWAQPPDDGDASRLAAHLETNGPLLIAAVADVRRAAAEEMQRRERSWRPVAEAILTWLPQARAARDAETAVEGLRSAEAWLRAAHDELRDERFRPLAEAAAAVAAIASVSPRSVASTASRPWKAATTRSTAVPDAGCVSRRRATSASRVASDMAGDCTAGPRPVMACSRGAQPCSNTRRKIRTPSQTL
jgi:hypothetical protein